MSSFYLYESILSSEHLSVSSQMSKKCNFCHYHIKRFIGSKTSNCFCLICTDKNRCQETFQAFTSDVVSDLCVVFYRESRTW